MTTQKPTTPEIRPNFKHRVDGDIADPLDIADIIGLMTFRAKGVLELLVINQDNGSIVADHIASAAIHAAIAEINDIDATMQAFHKAQRAGGVK